MTARLAKLLKLEQTFGKLARFRELAVQAAEGRRQAIACEIADIRMALESSAAASLPSLVPAVQHIGIRQQELAAADERLAVLRGDMVSARGSERLCGKLARTLGTETRRKILEADGAEWLSLQHASSSVQAKDD